MGRFIAADPVLDTSSAVSCNMFAYCGNDPVNRVDSNGRFWSSLWESVKEVLCKVGEAFVAIGEAVEYEIGIGAGIGGGFGIGETTLADGIKEDFINIQQSRGERFIGYYAEEFSSDGTFSKTKINAKHSWFIDDCTNSQDIYDCNNTEKTDYIIGYPAPDNTIISIKAYYGLGITFRFGYDFEYLFNRWVEIFS